MTQIWKTVPTVDQLNKISKNTAVDHLGIEITEVGDDFIKATMPVDQRTKQPMGLLHGGASVLLAESLGSLASVFCRNNEDEQPVGIEINANHLKSATDGIVTGVVKPVHIGRTLHVWEIRIENQKNQLCCISRLTVSLIPKR
tara:strand:- start:8279 stop:8707 length:429 start_codon:yes stop_codon:yes gene_type:complete